MNKNKIMKIKVIRFVYKLLKKTVNIFFRPIVKVYKFFRMKKSTAPKVEYNVGFIVQLSAIWDKQIGIYEELQKRKNINTFLFVVPEYDFKNDIVMNTYDDNNYFLNKYEEAIKAIDLENGVIDLRTYDLDYLFYPRPYDYYLPECYRSSYMYKYVKCCYIPYGLTGSENFDDLGYEFFDNIYCTFMDSDYQKELLESHYPVSSYIGAKKIFSLGYPVLSRFMDLEYSDEVQTIAWTPRWSMDAILGGSNFLRYCDDFIELVKTSNYKYIFRPHPMMFDELIKKNIIDESYKYDYLRKLEENGVIYDIVSPIEELFDNTDLLITDYSSIIPQFFVSNKPIIYCEGGIPLNKDYEEIVGFSYRADSWDNVMKNLESICKLGDIRSNERKIYIEKTYSKCRKSAKLIADKLENGV